jgi:ABC-type transport system involved in Fe-S cluster assembly fused permease/ATPase subunit
VLFNETIKYNIKYNDDNATDEQIRASANSANFNPEQEKFDELLAKKKDNTNKE